LFWIWPWWEIFYKHLGLCSLQCLHAFLVHWKVALPIFSGGIWPISLKLITQIAYMWSWALVAHVITSRFLLDFCPFLLKMIVVNNIRLLISLIHVRLVQKQFPLKVATCVPPFEQVAEKGANCFQKSILEILHNDSLTFFLIYLLICIGHVWGHVWVKCKHLVVNLLS
jgi:hypothetical protein